MDANEDIMRLSRAVGAEIRVARARANMSRRELSERTDMSSKTIERLEAGTRYIDIDQLFRIAAALGTTARKIIAAAEENL
ncbi:helix-turn-helix transcriptional regulator [Speluncibacter jeojiensis]|uniref:Helix-turn-helix domain-containing protein n=1 Tax=Speluncibacter jeojiensis TaxID=2710754 RepID=A0A9X4RC94_9ACTN|nr:helix-turn-helix domain-containing protein [Corynebacteriales bacterium D3-21]